MIYKYIRLRNKHQENKQTVDYQELFECTLFCVCIASESHLLSIKTTQNELW